MLHYLLLVGVALAAIENPKRDGEVQPAPQHSSSFSSSSYQSNYAVNSGPGNGTRNYQVVTGNCVFTNGILYDNGTQRPLTEDEEKQLQQYEQDMEQYSIDFARCMQQWSQNMMRQMFESFGDSFPFGNRRQHIPEPIAQPVMPKMPQVPCFCQSCKTTVGLERSGKDREYEKEKPRYYN